jgi:hypothetical protein
MTHSIGHLGFGIVDFRRRMCCPAGQRIAQMYCSIRFCGGIWCAIVAVCDAGFVAMRFR